MKKTILLALAILSAPAAALPITPVRVSMPTVRVASPTVYRAPTIQARPAAPVVVRPSAPSVQRPVVQSRPSVVVRRSTVPAPQPMAPRATLRAPTVPQRATASVAMRNRTAAASARRAYSYGGRTWRWDAPTMIPIWWATTMNRPYTIEAYDDFIRRCLSTPKPRRPRACERALRERGLIG